MQNSIANTFFNSNLLLIPNSLCIYFNYLKYKTNFYKNIRRIKKDLRIELNQKLQENIHLNKNLGPKRVKKSMQIEKSV